LRGDGAIGSVATNAGGRFTLALARGPTRTLRFSYRAYSNDASLSATATIRIAVFPEISLTIFPRATDNGDTVTWHGAVAGGPYPRGGLTLLVEVREGRRWVAFDQLNARDGRFAYSYTFLRTTVATTYEFRITIPASGAAGYDYLPAASRAVAVHVN
jgi:hypothetical protein